VDLPDTPETETGPQVLVDALREVLEALTQSYGTDDMNAWTAPRPSLRFTHPLGLEVGVVPASNRATYGQAIMLSDPVMAVSVLPLGQSGFVSPAGLPDPHLGDQLELYRAFAHKPAERVTLSGLYLPVISGSPHPPEG
jgi:penicillin amidase